MDAGGFCIHVLVIQCRHLNFFWGPPDHYPTWGFYSSLFVKTRVEKFPRLACELKIGAWFGQPSTDYDTQGRMLKLWAPCGDAFAMGRSSPLTSWQGIAPKYEVGTVSGGARRCI